MNKLLLKISNSLIMNNSCTSNLGLMDGKMGLTILLYHSSRITEYKSYLDIADSLLDEILAELGPSIDLTFSKGLAGIGFGLNHLIEHQFIDADPDDLLADVDEKLLFASLSSDNNKDFTNNFPLFSYGLYLDKRIKNHQGINVGIDFLAKKGIQMCDIYFKSNPIFNPINILYTNSMLFFLVSLKKNHNYSEPVDSLLEYFLRKTIQAIDNKVILENSLSIAFELLSSFPWENTLLEECQSKYQHSYNSIHTEDLQNDRSNINLDIMKQELLYFSSSKQTFEVDKINSWIDERLATMLDNNSNNFCKDMITVGLWIISKVYEAEVHRAEI